MKAIICYEKPGKFNEKQSPSWTVEIVPESDSDKTLIAILGSKPLKLNELFQADNEKLSLVIELEESS